jgi:transcription initiation factor TFIIIB Brf1 subunit/transcription initiation factor TFIIB
MTEIVKCHKCGSIIEEGYVKLSGGIRWKRSDDSWGNCFGGGSVLAPQLHGISLS